MSDMKPYGVDVFGKGAWQSIYLVAFRRNWKHTFSLRQYDSTRTVTNCAKTRYSDWVVAVTRALLERGKKELRIRASVLIEGAFDGWSRSLAKIRFYFNLNLNQINSPTRIGYEQIELPAKLPDYFLSSNKSNINQLDDPDRSFWNKCWRIFNLCTPFPFPRNQSVHSNFRETLYRQTCGIFEHLIQPTSEDETWGAGVGTCPGCRYPFVSFSSSIPFFHLICTNKLPHHTPVKW